MLVFSEYSSPRLDYVLQEVSRRWGIAIQCTCDWDFFVMSKGVRINYSKRNSADAPSVSPSGLLEEKGWKKVAPEIVVIEGIPCSFPSQEGNDFFSFDVFSSVFFHLSRHEEYHCDNYDVHGRFRVEDSVLYQWKMLHKPVVEYQLKFFEGYVKLFFSSFTTERKDPMLWVTIDIDNAWAYKNKPFSVQVGSFCKDVLKGKFSLLGERWRVIREKEPDPYDTYRYFMEAISNVTCMSRCFFLLGNRSKFDKNIPHTNKELGTLIRRVEEKIPVGIHPSYGVHLNIEGLHEEISRLQSITGEAVLYSRFHYLRMQLPQSYRNLAQGGVQEDHTMGHASYAGFRAGTCFPFRFYDLEQDRTSSLDIVPLTAMDGTLNEYMDLTPEEAISLSNELWKEVTRFGGDMVVLWHNETLNERGKWKNWRKVFEHQLSLSAIPG
jgi:hypothetical protein